MIVASVRLVDPLHRAEIMRELVYQDVNDPDALITWFYISVVVKILFTLCSSAFAVGIWITIVTAAKNREDPCGVRGLGMLDAANRAGMWLWVALLGISAAVFVYRIVIYTVALVGDNVDFAFPLMAVLGGEAVMVLMIVGITALLIVMWRALSDLAVQIRYMLYTGRVDGHIDPVSYVSLFALCGVSIYFAFFFGYDIISFVGYIVLAAAFLLLGISVKLVKGRVEWINYKNYCDRFLFTK